MSRRVCFVQGLAKQYRKPFFDGLHERLLSHGVKLEVVYSDANSTEAKRGDNIELPDSYGRKVTARWLMNERLIYQPIWPVIKGADLIIIDQANKFLMNYPLILASKLGLVKIAYWGHGKNRQQTSKAWSEWIKGRLLTSVDWWFAYTSGVAAYIKGQGFPAAQVTAVQNSIDVSAFRKAVEAVEVEETAAFRSANGIAPGDQVGLYCGGLHPDKQLPFMIAAAERIHAALPSFKLLVVGAGGEQHVVQSASQSHSWLRYVGPKFGHEKALCFSASEVFVCPGLVGLAVLDSFAAGLPMLTSDIPIHSPEIDYVETGFNGMVSAHDVQSYADMVIALLRDSERLSAMQANAKTSSQKYGVAQMVNNFSEGVLQCLSR